MNPILQLPQDFDGVARLFPLPDCVFFPHNVQPLHIFEERYREMIEDALASDQLLAMATLKPGFEYDYHSRPPVADQVCIGQIMSHEKTDDGRYYFLLAGVSRAVISEELPPRRSFRQVRVEVIGEQPSAPNPETRINELHQLVCTLAPKLGELLGKVEEPLSLAAYTDVVATHMGLETGDKLALLGDPDDESRADSLVRTLNEMRSGDDPRIEPRFSDN